MNQIQRKQAKDQIDLDDRSIEASVYFLAVMSRVLNPRQNHENYGMGLMLSISNALFNLPGAFINVIGAEKKAQNSFKGMGYSWRGNKDYLDQRIAHEKNLEGAGYNDLLQKFGCNTEMYIAVEDFFKDVVIINKTKNKDFKKRRKFWANYDIEDVTLGYNKARNKNLPVPCFFTHKFS